MMIDHVYMSYIYSGTRRLCPVHRSELILYCFQSVPEYFSSFLLFSLDKLPALEWICQTSQTVLHWALAVI